MTFYTIYKKCCLQWLIYLYSFRSGTRTGILLSSSLNLLSSILSNGLKEEQLVICHNTTIRWEYLRTSSIVKAHIHSFFSGGDTVTNIYPGLSPSLISKANFRSERKREGWAKSCCYSNSRHGYIPSVSSRSISWTDPLMLIFSFSLYSADDVEVAAFFCINNNNK